MLRRAFSLIELLVVLAIIAVLVAILIPALGPSRETANRVACAANLKGQGEALAAYAAGNGDKLPVFSPGDMASSHLNEEAANFTMALTGMPAGAGGQAVKWFFCPSSNSPVPATLGTVLGYSYLNVRGSTNDLTSAGPGSPLPVIAGNMRVGPALSYHDHWGGSTSDTAQEIALDLIVNNNAASDFSNPVPNVGSTSHMKGDTYPAGANVLCFDDHAEFRKFAGPTAPVPGTPDVTLRRAALRMNDGSIFYFPAP